MSSLKMKTMSRKLAMPLLGVLLWVLSIHAGTFAAATLLPRPTTGFRSTSTFMHKSDEDVSSSIGGQQEQSEIDELLSHIKITEKDLNDCVTFGKRVVNMMQRLETNLDWAAIHIKKGSPSHGQLIESSPEAEALQQGRAAMVATRATVQLVNTHCTTFNLNGSECAKFVTSFKMNSSPIMQSTCDTLKAHCREEEIFSKYRSIDGSCNHISDRDLGQSFTSYARLLFPTYLDGIMEFRRSVNKKHALPSPRQISNALVQNIDVADKEFTLAVMQWGQFISHDMAHTAQSKMIHSGNTIECCEAEGYNLSPRYVHPLCAPISVPIDDPYYSKHNVECMTYVRSIAAIRSDCSFGPLEQVNQATHFIDGSNIYGANERKAHSLRTFVDGQLEITERQDRAFLPLSENPTQDCQVTSGEALCFASGDSRVNGHPHLTTIYTIWHREHNRIAEELATLNPTWDDETLYQEARRIVIAEIQSITYNEWLPAILGKHYMNKITSAEGFSEDVDPSISNSFATAAMQFVTSLMQGSIRLYDENRDINITLGLRDHFNRPHVIQKIGLLDGLIRGLATQSSQKLDTDYARVITTDLFYNGKYGYDALSLDIQRGRDHGLPSYTAYRTLCGLESVNTFEDLLNFMPMQAVKALSDVYQSPEDIDLIVGGLAEAPSGGSLMGPTLSCLIADQFLRSKQGDRYFYSNTNQPVPFTKAQISELEKVSLARIFCDNGDDIESMQSNVFKKLSVSNDLVQCDSLTIPHLNLKLWKDNYNKYI